MKWARSDRDNKEVMYNNNKAEDNPEQDRTARRGKARANHKRVEIGITLKAGLQARQKNSG